MGSQTELPNSAEPIEGDYFTGKEMVELERERIRSADKRTEIARLAIEANNASDQRQFDYHMSRLEQETKLIKDHIKLAGFLTYGTYFISVMLISIFTYMSFFGDSEQTKTAYELFSKLITAFAGIGSYLTLKGIFNKLTKPPSE